MCVYENKWSPVLLLFAILYACLSCLDACTWLKEARKWNRLATSSLSHHNY